jgi:GR25 family glycosyltransferase involved in LPS biosynthesis
MKLDGYFINLDRSEDRRAFMERQLAVAGCDSFIKRFSAIDGATLGQFDHPYENGIRACRASHAKIICESDPRSTTVILEDDAELSTRFPQLVNPHTLEVIERSNPDMDVLFLECYPEASRLAELLLATELRFRNRAQAGQAENERHPMSFMTLLDAAGVYNACAMAYVVTPKGKRTMRALFDAETDPSRAVDHMYQAWTNSGAIRAILGIPFVAAPAFLPTTISYDLDRWPERDDVKIINLFRRLLFAGDPNINEAYLATLLAGTPAVSPEYEIGMKLVRRLLACSEHP